MQELIIRGVPRSLAKDGWWFSETAEATAPPITRSEQRRQDAFSPFAVLCVLLLVAISDFLFWKQPVGVSLVLFSACLSVAALANLRPQCSGREWIWLAGAWVLSALPVMEYFQATSVLILVLGHTALLVWCAKRSEAATLLRTILFLPFMLVFFAFEQACEISEGIKGGKAAISPAALATWVLPIIVGSLFLLLFVGANPVFERWMNDLANTDLGPDVLNRVTFWAAIGLFVLPFALFKAFAPYLRPAPAFSREVPWLENAFINARSVTNSLILFNAMFLLQNISDIAILWGGARLPDGMTYAIYAHRGAYPLMATSILAGLLALVSRPFTETSEFLKALLLLWVFQNVVLLSSALMRLDLYVEAYGLTYLRLRAGIGMFVLLVGMILLIWLILRAKSNFWLTGVFMAFAASTLYVGSFVNFGYVIASVNLSREDRPLDTHYLCGYTEVGVKALRDYAIETGKSPCGRIVANWELGPQNWRDWDYRSARLAAHQTAYLLSQEPTRASGRDTVQSRP